jgi:AcrR family transcriptional regulator
MVKSHMDAKEKLLQATLAILGEGIDPELITTRDIAKRAGLNIALINYHFQSKDNLIEQAIEIKMTGIADEMYDPKNFSESPVERLRNMLKKNTEFGLRYYPLMKKGLAFEIKNGSLTTVRAVLPLLQEIFQANKSERELYLLALQLLIPLQIMGIYPEVYQKNLNVNIRNTVDVNNVIDILIDNLLSE